MSTDTETRLTMTWIEVPDARGGTRLQARWIEPSAVEDLTVLTPAVSVHAA